MNGEDIRIGRRKTDLKKWELAHILRISQDSLLKMERGLEPIPVDLQLKIKAEFARQQEKVNYGTARNVVNSLVSEGYSLAGLAVIMGTTRAKVRQWQLGKSEPDPQELLKLLELPPPPQPHPVGHKMNRVKRRARW